MARERPDILMIGQRKPVIVDGLSKAFNLHVLADAPDKDEFINAIADKVRAIAVSYTNNKVPAELMQKFPNLEIVSSFGVGYDHVDAKWAGAHGIVVTNTPTVLNEEVADTAIGLLLSTLFRYSQAERHLRAAGAAAGLGPFPSRSLRHRSIGIVGMGGVGQAIARRIEAFGVPVAYHSRKPRSDVPYKYYPNLLDLARDTDTLIVIVPGGAETRYLINKDVLEALGPNGILINMARGSVVDEAALVKALNARTILSAGLDVFEREPNVSPELIAIDHIVLFPHVGSASVYTRAAMDQLVVDNLVAWANGQPPLTPVAETPLPAAR